MENTKTIIPFLFFLFITGCKSMQYYNEQGNRVPVPKGFKEIKSNLGQDADGNLYFVIDNNQFYATGKKEEIDTKKNGMMLQDSIYISEKNSFISSKDAIDLKSYEEIEKKTVYKDKKHVYYNIKTEYFNYPYTILDVEADLAKFLKGYYIKDSKNVFSYGGIHCSKIDSVDIETFNVIELMDTVKNRLITRGVDKRYIYWNDSRMSMDDIEFLPVARKTKDSLQKVYFSN
jgi:hypothetical protein